MADETAAFTAFLAAAITVAVMMVMLVFAIGTAHDKVIKSMKGSTRSVKRGSGIILMVVGIWLMILSIWADLFKQILIRS